MELTTEECASLVTLIKNPNERSPLNNPEVNRDGRNYVLGRMREEGMISSSELARLKALPLMLNSQPLRRGTTHLYERIAEAGRPALGEDALASGRFTDPHDDSRGGPERGAEGAAGKSGESRDHARDTTTRNTRTIAKAAPSRRNICREPC